MQGIEPKKYIFLEHPSELKIKAFGKDMPELFCNCALALMDYIYGRTKAEVKYFDKVVIDSTDIEALLVDWLSEILWLSDTNKRAYIKFHVIKFSSTQIIAEIGSIAASAKHDVKAVTYNELIINETKDGYEAIVVFDI